MSQKFANVARSRLVGSLNSSATSFTVESATADLFPIANTPDWLSLNDWFKAVLQDDAGNIEIIYVGVRSLGSGVFSNVQRGREGTTARSWSAGAVVGQRLTAADHEGLVNIKSTNNVFTGTNEFTQPVQADILGQAATALVAGTVPDGTIGTDKIVDRAVTAGKMLAATTARLWGRISAGNGDVEQLTSAQVTANFVDAASTSAAGKVRFATDAEAQGGTVPDRAVTPDNLGATILGIGQSWQDLTASRVAGTLYTNTTGRVIKFQVSGIITANLGNTNFFEVNGQTVGNIAGNGASANMHYSQGYEVPPGHTYRVASVAGTSIQRWSELR